MKVNILVGDSSMMTLRFESNGVGYKLYN